LPVAKDTIERREQSRLIGSLSYHPIEPW